MDFTLAEYRRLLENFIQNGYSFQTFVDFINNPDNKVVILRHDVDKRPINSLKMAKLENELNIPGTYFFRIVKQSFDERTIKNIVELGHEIGYHYEDISLVSKQSAIKLSEHKIAEIALEGFSRNISILRSYYPVQTICMHGSPLSKWDNKILWKYYDYKDFGVSGEPYYDIDFGKILYLTDTGRRWNGRNVSIRDKYKAENKYSEDHDLYNSHKVKPQLNSSLNMTAEAVDFQRKYNFRTTSEIVSSLRHNQFPEKAMLTIHPQRWSDNYFAWTWELLAQKAKNLMKILLVLIKNAKSLSF